MSSKKNERGENGCTCKTGSPACGQHGRKIENCPTCVENRAKYEQAVAFLKKKFECVAPSVAPGKRIQNIFITADFAAEIVGYTHLTCGVYTDGQIICHDQHKRRVEVAKANFAFVVGKWDIASPPGGQPAVIAVLHKAVVRQHCCWRPIWEDVLKGDTKYLKMSL